MSQTFLANYMRFAKDVTRAARALSVDADLNVVDSIDLTREQAEASNFHTLINDCLGQALQHNKAVITNNVITDPSKAPTTNTNFSDLRVVVAFPVVQYGAIYLDQHIRYGIIPKETVERLIAFASHLVENGQTDVSVEELSKLYKQF